MFGPYPDGNATDSKKIKKKFLLSGNGTWHSQYKVVMVARQLADQWVVRDGHPQ